MRAICLLAISAALFSTGAHAQAIYKCVGKDGKTAYSNAPCPGAKEVGGASSQSRAMTVDSMTESQANLAFDCTEVLFNATKPTWRERDRETADFNKYCPAFGFRTPFGPDTASFNKAHGEQLLAKLRRLFRDVPSGTRVYVDGTRQPPSFDSAEYVLKEPPAPKGPVDVSIFPVLQPGKWKVRSTTAGVVSEDEVCGDPLDNLRSDMLSQRGQDPMGCTTRATAPAARSARIVYECAADRYENGRTVMKGRTELSIVSPSPQSVRIELKSTVKDPMSAQATRIGDCATR